MIDNQSVQRRLCSLQFQPELLTQSFLKRGPKLGLNVLFRRRALRFRSEFEREIEPPAQSRSIYRRATQVSDRGKKGCDPIHAPISVAYQDRVVRLRYCREFLARCV